jgi:hypothetical protein
MNSANSPPPACCTPFSNPELAGFCGRRRTVAPYPGRGRQPRPRDHQRPCSLEELALRAGQQACADLVWRRGSRGLQRAGLLALRVRPAGVTHAARRPGKAWRSCRWAGCWSSGQGQGHPGQVLAVGPACDHAAGGAGPPGQVALASGAGRPRTQRRARGWTTSRSRLRRLAPPCDPGLGRARVSDPGAAPRPKPAGRPELVAAAGAAAGPAGLLGWRLSPLPPSRPALAAATGTSTSTDLTEPH